MLPSTLINLLTKFTFLFERCLKSKESIYDLIELRRLRECEKESIHEINVFSIICGKSLWTGTFKTKIRMKGEVFSERLFNHM